MLVVIILGVGGYHAWSENDLQPLNVGLSTVNNNDKPEEIISEQKKLLKDKKVSVAECAADFQVDTEVGVMYINYDIPDILY